MSKNITPSKQELEHSRPLDKHLWSKYHAANALLNTIWQSGFQEFDRDETKGGKRPKTSTKDQLKVLLLNLFKIWHQDSSLYLGIQMSKSGYKANSRYNALHISAEIIKLVKKMHELEYIDWHKGSESAQRTTRIWSEDKLLKIFEKSNLCILDLMPYAEQEVIILNNKNPEDKKGKPIPYEDTPEITAMRKDLREYNKLLQRTYIDIGDLQEPRVPAKDQSTINIDQTSKLVRRIFYRGDWSLGGRFFGGWWQRVNSDYRSRILINDQLTLELDYSGLHINLIYGMERQQPPKDPYTIPLVNPETTPKQQRAWIKGLVLMAINANSLRAAFSSFRNKQEAGSLEKSFKDKQLQELLNKFIECNPIVEPYLGTDKGVELMAIDGRITARVINHFTRKKIPILTVHDSYIIDHEYSGELRGQMNKAIKEELGGYEITITQEKIGIDQYRSFKAQEPTNTYFHLQMLQNLPERDRSNQYQVRYREFIEWIARKD